MPSELVARVIRPTALPRLYVAYAALQALDSESTARALEAGAREANPALRSVAGNRGTMLALKTATTAGTILFVERLRKTHPTAAIILMGTLDSAYAAIVAHNFRHAGPRH